MDKENEIDERAGDGGAAMEESVLAFLARHYPGDEKSLETLTSLLSEVGGLDDERLLDALYKGVNYTRDVEAAREEGCIAGRNEKIELEMQADHAMDPVDDGGMDDGCDDLPLLRHIRRSVWDD